MSKGNPQINVKNYEHFNKALPNWDSKQGKYIGSKRQYENEVRKAGLTKFTEPSNQPDAKPVASTETRTFLNSLNADRKGNVKLSDRQIDYMIKSGAIKDRDKQRDIPHDMRNGGFR